MGRTDSTGTGRSGQTPASPASAGPTSGTRAGRAGGRRGSGRRRGPSRLTAVLGVLLVLVVAGAAVVQFLTVSSVEVSGTVNQDPGEVRTASGVSEGDRMVTVDTGAAASSVSVLPWVKTVTVSRGWPTTVKITVTEHTPVGVLDDGGTPVVVDTDGVQFLRDVRPDGLTPMKVASSDDAAVTAAASVLAALSPEVKGQVREISAPAADSVTLRFDGDREVFWGTADRAAEKAEATRVVLTRDGARWNVSNPALPSVRG
ncbi:MAG: FtsQ-type POTRA domain-containing protein [Corynebacterium provencense]|uniref:cell division protein FtsQ/DivIB n=1 Tax=Corynebacterium provencense TaxID=1737425 RepID=UPI002989D549|nr:FtsQ-type POTRA domain-containing protein [Corynebacterium provencense]